MQLDFFGWIEVEIFHWANQRFVRLVKTGGDEERLVLVLFQNFDDPPRGPAIRFVFIRIGRGVKVDRCAAENTVRIHGRWRRASPLVSLAASAASGAGPVNAT